jgi:hypothetical protein
MNIGKDPLGIAKLLNIAARVEALATQASLEPLAYRIAGRLVRDPHNLVAFSQAIIEGVMRGDDVIFLMTGTPINDAQLQSAMWQVSMDLMETIWERAHPDGFGLARDEENFDLPAVRREKVRAMIKDCKQGAILSVTVKEYFDHLTAAGESQEVAAALADWLSLIHGGDTPST